MLSEVLHALNPRALPAGWRAPLGIFTGCLLLTVAVFAPTYWTMVDTWIRSAIEAHYPDCDRGSYADTSRAIRETFGGAYAGYAQTYVFHYLRTRAE